MATTGAALIAFAVTSETLQSRLRTQMVSAAGVVSRGDLALNPAILQNVRGIIGADVITFGPGGRIIASTVADDRVRLIQAAESVIKAHTPSATGMATADCGVPCLIAYRPVEGHPDTAVALIAETSELSAAIRTATRAIVFGAALSAVVMVIIGQLVVRRVTAPLQKLVRFAREVAPGDFRTRAAVGDGEIGALADAFNGMLDRLQQSQEALVRTEKLALAGVLAARVAHDIRNPLSSIKMQTQLLQSRLRVGPDDRATFVSVLDDVRQVESVIRDLVDLARPGDLKPEPTSVNIVLREALQQLSPQFAHRKISVRTTLAEGLPEVALDVARFRQALLNVLVNASEAMPTGGQITVESRQESSSVVIEICDDGVGIDPKLLDKVFDPFFSTKREGVGLGLVNAKAVVEGHGGRISLAARGPRGTCAHIDLPIHHG
jgi:signal transduction histidine kinase